MAKTKTQVVTGEEYIVNPNSSDVIWTMDSTHKTFKINYAAATDDYYALGSTSEGCVTAYRDENDLVLVTRFLIMKNSSVKTIKNTVKDYFTTEGAAVKIYNSNNSSWVDLTASYLYKNVSGVTSSTIYNNDIRFIGSKNADTYNLNDYQTTTADNYGWVFDEAGNDKYYSFQSSYYNVYDFKGNDIYNLSSTYSGIKDFAGNDKYVLDTAYFELNDYLGNDNYDIYNNKENSYIYDHKGSDKYSLTNISKYLEIYETEGNDTYTVTGSKLLRINEYKTGNKNKSGNDTYNIYDSAVSIYETSEFSGNDTYNITVSNGSGISDWQGNDKYNVYGSKNLSIADKSGNDKWTVNLTSNSSIIDFLGNDNYVMSNSMADYIHDYGGNDKYLINENSYNIDIINTGGADTYVVEDSIQVSISDSDGLNDKYTFNNVDNMFIQSCKIADDGGNETYNITDSQNIRINDRSRSVSGGKKVEKNTFNLKNSTFEIKINDNYDSSADNQKFSSTNTYNIVSSSGSICDKDKDNDTYKVDKLNGALRIEDHGGTDKLIISQSKANDLVFLAGLSKQATTYINDCCLYIYDKTNGGYAAIDFWFKSGEGKAYVEGNAGVIESIKAGGKEITKSISLDTINSVITSDNVAVLESSLANWMNTNNYTSIGDVFDKGNAEDIGKLIQAYSVNA